MSQHYSDIKFCALWKILTEILAIVYVYHLNFFCDFSSIYNDFI